MNKQIIELAKAAIEAHLLNEDLPDKLKIIEESPDFAQKKATFVTLKLDGKLRGCVGSLNPYRDLYEDVVTNALLAAFKDDRFTPLTMDEFENLEVEISILQKPEKIEYEDTADLRTKIEIGLDGVILQKQDKSATFLPSVWDELKDFDSFFVHLGKKAGFKGDNCLKFKPDVYKYRVESIK